MEQLGDPDPERVLMIGDSLDHDIARRARAKGMLTLLVTSGIHREALVGATDLPASIRHAGGIRGADDTRSG